MKRFVLDIIIKGIFEFLIYYNINKEIINYLVINI